MNGFRFPSKITSIDKINEFDLSQYVKIKTKDEGGCGDILKYKKKEDVNNNLPQQIIVKKDKNGHRRIAKEILFLSNIKCSFIAEILGKATDENGNLQMVMPYYEFKFKKNKYTQEFDDTQKFIILYSLIIAMKYLHQQKDPILHHDLKENNIMLKKIQTNLSKTTLFIPILIDFGISKTYQDANQTESVDVHNYKKNPDQSYSMSDDFFKFLKLEILPEDLNFSNIMDVFDFFSNESNITKYFTQVKLEIIEEFQEMYRHEISIEDDFLPGFRQIAEEIYGKNFHTFLFHMFHQLNYEYNENDFKKYQSEILSYYYCGQPNISLYHFDINYFDFHDIFETFCEQNQFELNDCCHKLFHILVDLNNSDIFSVQNFYKSLSKLTYNITPNDEQLTQQCFQKEFKIKFMFLLYLKVSKTQPINNDDDIFAQVDQTVIVEEINEIIHTIFQYQSNNDSFMHIVSDCLNLFDTEKFNSLSKEFDECFDFLKECKTNNKQCQMINFKNFENFQNKKKFYESKFDEYKYFNSTSSIEELIQNNKITKPNQSNQKENDSLDKIIKIFNNYSSNIENKENVDIYYILKPFLLQESDSIQNKDKLKTLADCSLTKEQIPIFIYAFTYFLQLIRLIPIPFHLNDFTEDDFVFFISDELFIPYFKKSIVSISDSDNDINIEFIQDKFEKIITSNFKDSQYIKEFFEKAFQDPFGKIDVSKFLAQYNNILKSISNKINCQQFMFYAFKPSIAMLFAYIHQKPNLILKEKGQFINMSINEDEFNKKFSDFIVNYINNVNIYKYVIIDNKFSFKFHNAKSFFDNILKYSQLITEKQIRYFFSTNLNINNINLNTFFIDYYDKSKSPDTLKRIHTFFDDLKQRFQNNECITIIDLRPLTNFASHVFEKNKKISAFYYESIFDILKICHHRKIIYLSIDNSSLVKGLYAFSMLYKIDNLKFYEKIEIALSYLGIISFIKNLSNENNNKEFFAFINKFIEAACTYREKKFIEKPSSHFCKKIQTFIKFFSTIFNDVKTLPPEIQMNILRLDFFKFLQGVL